MFMTTMDICYCVLILAGAFCLVALGVLFIRTSTAIKQTGDTVEMAQDTLKRVDKILDDVNYKLDLLNAPVETVAKFFDPQRPKFNPLKMMMSFIFNNFRNWCSCWDVIGTKKRKRVKRRIKR